MRISSKNNKKVFLNILFLALLFAITISLLSCSTKETTTDESIFIPEPANQFAVDKETETTKIEETKAHHPYEEIKISADNEIVIGEKNFLTRVNHIKNNIAKYEKSYIIIEGMFGKYISWDETFEFPMVYRNGPGCCGDDQYGGFFLINIDQQAFEIDDWIKVRGTPFNYEHTDSEGEVQNYAFLLVESIEVLPTKERKAEMVND